MRIGDLSTEPLFSKRIEALFRSGFPRRKAPFALADENSFITAERTKNETLSTTLCMPCAHSEPLGNTPAVRKGSAETITSRCINIFEESPHAKSANEKKPTLIKAAAKNIEEQIRRRAYELYEARGRQDGRDWEDWFRAESEITGKAAKAARA